VPIPIVDHVSIIRDLNAWDWRDFKIDTVCGFSAGYVAQVKCGNVRSMAQERAQRLYNFWEQEAVARGAFIPPYGPPASRETLQTQILPTTTY